MWEVVAVMVPLVVSINAVIFKRLDDLDKNISSMAGGFVSRDELIVKFNELDNRLGEINDKLSAIPRNYVSREELAAKFEAVSNRMDAISDRIELTRDILSSERRSRDEASDWYERRRVPRRDDF